MKALDAPHYVRSVRLERERVPSFDAYPFSLDALIYSLEADGIRETAYEDTEHYQITRRFLTDHRGMLKRLLE